MKTSAFYQADDFDEEIKVIFQRKFFALTAFSLSPPNGYYSFQLGDAAVTCRHTSAGVRAFSNVCLHRCCLIDPLGRGQRRFQCAYHGWQYDAAGCLSQTPGFDLQQIAQPQLPSLTLAKAEDLLFLQLQKGAQDSTFVSEVEALTTRLNIHLTQPPFHAEELLHQCNWKLLVENVLDREHLDFVHAASFARMEVRSSINVDYGSGQATLWNQLEPPANPIAGLLKHLPGAQHHYWHGYVFPNLFLANTNNLIGFVNQLVPLAPEQSLLRWELYELPALLAQPEGVRQQVREQAIAFTRKVLNEDKPIVEMCQRGLRSPDAVLQVQAQERQILRFHEMYRQHMGQ